MPAALGEQTMRVINTFDRIPDCFINGRFDLEAWRAYTRMVSDELSQKCEQDAKGYDFDKQVLPVVARVQADKEAALLANASFTSVAKRLESRLCPLFQREPELDLILYLGLCNGAGWATTLEGREAVLVGIEKVLELGWQTEAKMQALIFHEIGHIWHKTYGTFELHPRTKGEASLVQLYKEGVAMVCEQILCQNENAYHQDEDGWLAWCVAHQAEIKREYQKRVDNHTSTQDFFGDWCRYKSHSDVGYYLGCEFVKYLRRRRSLAEIANLELHELFRQFKAFSSSA